MNFFREVAGFKLNTQKTAIFPCTSNELPEKEIKNAMPFTIE
jgi:hypothetical protein